MYEIASYVLTFNFQEEVGYRIISSCSLFLYG